MRAMHVLAAAAIVLLSACASVGEEGWTGQGAVPFDSARAQCEIETQTTEGPAFEVCMASKGWTRPQR